MDGTISIDGGDDDAVVVPVAPPPPPPPPLPPTTAKGDLDRANRLLKVAKASIDDLKAQLAARAEEYEKLKAEYQKFRIKAEVSRAQSASEIARLAEVNLKYKQFNVSSGDVLNELEACRRRIEALEQQRFDGDAELRKSAFALAESRAMLQECQASCEEWKRRAEHTGPAALKQLSSSLEREIAELRADNEALKRTSEQATKDKDEALRHANRLAETRRDSVDLAYLRDIIFKYLTTTDERSKFSIESAITTVLRFSPEELARVRLARSGWRASLGL
jgi:chromosome segregation ATPase